MSSRLGFIPVDTLQFDILKYSLLFLVDVLILPAGMDRDGEMQ